MSVSDRNWLSVRDSMRRARFCIWMSALASLPVSCLVMVPAAPVLAAGADKAGVAAPLPFTTTAGWLSGVAATSAGNAWAVGGTHHGAVLILHWDGSNWAPQAGPRLRGGAFLNSVAATSARNAWAVGAAGTKTLILHWNGVNWRRVPSPSPTGWPQLTS